LRETGRQHRFEGAAGSEADDRGPCMSRTMAGDRDLVAITSEPHRANIHAKRVMLLVITAVAGAPRSETCTRVFCTAIAATPSMPATTALGASGSTGAPVPAESAKKAQKQKQLQA
jgi:hypothetical protein